MNRFIESLNAFSAYWSAWLWRACWQTAIVVAVAWLLSVALRRSSPWLRSWIWRLAYVKILLVLVWTTPVSLPLLPPSNQPSLAATATSPPAPTDATSLAPTTNDSDNAATIEPATTPLVADNADSDTLSSTPNNAITEAPAATPSAFAADSSSRAIADGAASSEPVAASAKLSATAWLFLIWTAGAIAVISWFALETRRAFALYRSARRIENASLAALVATVCNQLGLKHSVQLAESDLVGGPMLVKFLHPLIVFPSGMLAQSEVDCTKKSPSPCPLPPGERVLISPSPSTGEGRGEGEAAPYATIKPSDSEASILTQDEIRLVLAHELAHIERHDLSWNFLSALVHAMLYFHPFVWFAHRSARQEQEMACDELVVTRLGVERHEYGQLLVKIVRQVGRQMNSAVATVGMSKSYQTLSRRIGAMGQFRKHTRREIFAAASLLTLAAGVALVPWRVVAQDDANSKAGDSKSIAGAEAAEVPASLVDASPAELKKLLVGTWQGGHYYDELVLKDDNSFERFSRYWYFTAQRADPDGKSAELPPQEAAFQDRYEKGTWKTGTRQGISDGSPKTVATLILESTIDEFNLPLWYESGRKLSPDRQAQRGAAAEPIAGRGASNLNVFSIERLDNSLLRLKTIEGRVVTLSWRNEGKRLVPETTPTLFFRREASPKSDAPNVPPEVQKLGELVRLDSEETRQLALLNVAAVRGGGFGRGGRGGDVDANQVKPSLVTAEQVDLIARIAAARRHEIDFAKLFNLTPQEATAFRELMRLADDRYSTAVTLTRTAGNLSPVEAEAMRKIVALQSEFSSVRTNGTNLRRGAPIGGRDPQVLEKVTGYLNDLNTWLSKSMYSWRPL